jgi:hypothetical protein
MISKQPMNEILLLYRYSNEHEIFCMSPDLRRPTSVFRTLTRQNHVQKDCRLGPRQLTGRKSSADEADSFPLICNIADKAKR